jgi:hypothetical protein
MMLLRRKQLVGFGLDLAAAVGLTAIGWIATRIAHSSLPITILEILGLAVGVMTVMAVYSRTFDRMADYWEAEKHVLSGPAPRPWRAESAVSRELRASNPASNR